MENGVGLRMKSVLLVAMAALVVSAPAAAQRTAYSTLSVEQLIDQLTEVRDFGPGLNSMGSYEGFIAENKPLRFSVGVLGAPPSTVPSQMRELVRRGGAALPLLLQHLTDARPTKLVVGNNDSKKNGSFYAVQYFSDEYDARERTLPPLNCSTGRVCEGAPDFRGTYTVRIGDICFVLIGQIVNRWLNAVRYQPTAILMINSPVQTPSLAVQVRKDWGDVDAEGLKAALLADLHRTQLVIKDMDGRAIKGMNNSALRVTWDGALQRLRVYYPSVYAGLTGDDRKKRLAFEKRERQQ